MMMLICEMQYFVVLKYKTFVLTLLTNLSNILHQCVEDYMHWTVFTTAVLFAKCV